MAKKDDRMFSKDDVVTPVGRLSYPAFIKPREQDKGDPKFGCSILFPKDSDFTGIGEAIKNLAMAKWNGEKKKSDLWPTLKDGDEYYNSATSDTEKAQRENYKGMMFIQFRSKKPFVLRGADGKSELAPEKFYAGCNVRAKIGFCTYEGTKLTDMKDGIRIICRGIQFYGDNERFGHETVFDAAPEAAPKEPDFGDDNNNDEFD